MKKVPSRHAMPVRRATDGTSFVYLEEDERQRRAQHKGHHVHPERPRVHGPLLASLRRPLLLPPVVPASVRRRQKASPLPRGSGADKGLVAPRQTPVRAAAAVAEAVDVGLLADGDLRLG